MMEKKEKERCVLCGWHTEHGNIAQDGKFVCDLCTHNAEIRREAKGIVNDAIGSCEANKAAERRAKEVGYAHVGDINFYGCDMVVTYPNGRIEIRSDQKVMYVLGPKCPKCGWTVGRPDGHDGHCDTCNPNRLGQALSPSELYNLQRRS